METACDELAVRCLFKWLAESMASCAEKPKKCAKIEKREPFWILNTVAHVFQFCDSVETGHCDQGCALTPAEVAYGSFPSSTRPLVGKLESARGCYLEVKQYATLAGVRA